MAMELAMPRAIPGEKILTEGSALGVGLVNGVIWKYNAKAGFFTTLVSALGGMVGSVFSKGVAAEVLEGASAGALGAFGVLLPFMVGGTSTGAKAVSAPTKASALPPAVTEAPRNAAQSVAWQPKVITT